MNNAPFKIGQKVKYIDCVDGVYIDDCPEKLKKGNIYTVIDVCLQKGWLHSNKKEWFIEVDSFPGFSFIAKDFRPIEEPKEKIRYVAVSETLRQKSIEIAAIETN